MDLQMNGKTALVTGASAGIGKAIAFALAREGVDVAICARCKEPLEAAAGQIARETNRKIVAIPADLTKPDDQTRCLSLDRRSPGRHQPLPEVNQR
jgi:3-oxoacyl-[acyl-carrier protein] reductase